MDAGEKITPVLGGRVDRSRIDLSKPQTDGFVKFLEGLLQKKTQGTGDPARTFSIGTGPSKRTFSVQVFLDPHKGDFYVIKDTTSRARKSQANAAGSSDSDKLRMKGLHSIPEISVGREGVFAKPGYEAVVNQLLKR